jgi:diguanylate cyclase (GGDEF)-like protein
MTNGLPFRRVLLAASDEGCGSLREPFTDEALAGWQLAEADSWERAHFVLHHDTCDALLLDESLGLDAEGLAWLAGPRETPAVLLTRPEADIVTAALEGGADVWLPRDLALGHPALLAAALELAGHRGDLRCRLRVAGGGLQDCRRHVGRLVDLLWQSTARDPRVPWHSHRHMLERLQEELARTARHGTPFSLVLGEVQVADDPEGKSLTAWAAERVAQSKRRCDVAGQYGPHGFMLLLANTSAEGAATFCRRLEQALALGTAAEGGPVAAAFGIAACSDGRVTPPGLLRRAEEELEAARARAAEQAVH